MMTRTKREDYFESREHNSRVMDTIAREFSMERDL